MKTTTVATFNDLEHANPALRQLNEAGFHASVRDESRWQTAHFSEHLASVKVEVPEAEFDSARARLREWEPAAHLLEQSVCCPECGSADVDYPQVTRKFIMPTVQTLLYKLGVVEKQFYCNICQATWPLRDKLEPERNVLNWPIKKTPLHQDPVMTP